MDLFTIEDPIDYANYSDFWNDSWLANYTYPEDYEDEETWRPGAPHILAVAIYAVTFVVGVPGNAAVIWVTGCRAKATVNSVCFLNLAVADLAYCCSLPLQAANVLSGNRWPSGAAACKLLPAAIVLNLSASVFVLSAVSVDRCLAVTRPVRSQRWRTARWARWACAVAWLLALLMCLPPLLLRTVRRRPGPGSGTSCLADYAAGRFGARTRQVVELSRALLTFALPLLCMAACYLLIALRVRRARFARSGQPARLAALLVLAFFACWLPYHLFGLLQALLRHPVALLWDYVAVGLASLNSALNPLLYVFAGRDFRRRLRRSLPASLHGAFSEELTVSGSRPRSRSSVENHL